MKKVFDRGQQVLRSGRRRGLTLIELIVVLIILVGLGGLLVPVIGNALTRTHVATCSANFPEITQALMRMETFRGVFGDGWDSALNESGDPVNNDLPGNGSDYITVTLNADDVALLADVGIANVFDHPNTPGPDYNITFNPGYVARSLEAGDALLSLDAGQQAQLSLQPGTYVVLGIGPNWTGLRDVAFETPVHFGDLPGNLPHEVYSRFQAIFQIRDAGGDPLPKAQFKGVTIGLNGDDYETADFHVAVYWTEVNQN